MVVIVTYHPLEVFIVCNFTSAGCTQWWSPILSTCNKDFKEDTFFCDCMKLDGM